MWKVRSGVRSPFSGVGLCLMAAVLVVPFESSAQAPIGSGTYSLRIYHVNYGFYPIVQAYLRTWDDEREPLQNLNIANIGLQVRGRNYDPHISAQQRQYSIETIERRAEGFRTVFALDGSLSMQGEPFADALNALNRFVEAKRPVDQVAVIAIRDLPEGYEVVSPFESNPTLLYQRIRDIKCDGMQTRLYDSVAAALEMCGTAFRGDMTSLEYAVLSTVVVLSDGKDEGSAISREELVNRIGMMRTPIPVHCIAFTKIDRAHLRNMEAISRASFGRYWDVQDTKQISRVMQDVHRINRSDYVVTFRAYVDVDGGSHPFRIGVEYPSGSGHLLYSSSSFEAIDSPAVFNPALRERYEQLLAAYPALTGTPFAGASVPTESMEPAAAPHEVTPGAIETMPGAPPPPAEAAKEPVDPVDVASPDEGVDEDQDIIAWAREILPLIGAGAGILALLGLIVFWVKSGGKSASAPSPKSTAPSSSHESAMRKSTTHGAVDSDTRTRPITSADPQDRT